MPMSTEQIVTAISTHRRKMPTAAFRAAVAQRDTVIPELIHLLEEAVTDLEALSGKDDYMGHLSALYLLAQFRDVRAHALLVRLLRADSEILDEILGDTVTEGLDRLLASTCGGDCTQIQRLVEDRTVDEYVRGAALRALVICVAEGEMARDEVITYYRGLFRGRLGHESSIVWSHLVSCCCDLYPGELMGEIELAYARDLVDPGFISWQSVQRVFAAGQERALSKLASSDEMHFIQDVLHDLPW